MKRMLILALAFLLLSGLRQEAAQGAAQAAAYRLSIIHVNDTHSRLEPSLTRIAADCGAELPARPVYLELGGYPCLAEAIAALRSSETNPLVLHAGDFFQGTLYYTKYQGAADLAFWNLVRPDAATLGNHEFDKGPLGLRDAFLSKAAFPILDANVDMSGEPALKGFAPEAYRIIELGGQRIGLIGATTIETPFISSPGGAIAFTDPAAAAQRAADALSAAGVDKIVLISHLGYEEDLKLAAATRGIDVIAGGHSHSLLGSRFRAEGLSPAGEYPTLVKDAAGGKTLVVQAWEWGKVLGDLVVDFDAKGAVQGFEDRSFLVADSRFIQAYDLPDASGELQRVRWRKGAEGISTEVYDGKAWVPARADSVPRWNEMYGKLKASLASRPEIRLLDPDPAVLELARGYEAGVAELQRSEIAQVGEDLRRGFNSGPGPLVADAMRAYTGARIAMTNVGGVRVDLLAGPLTTAMVYELAPFGNTLVAFEAKGAEILRILEDGIDFGLGKYGAFPANPLVYVSGLRLTVDPSRPKGSRVLGAKVLGPGGAWSELDPGSSYSMVVNSFMAAGGDKYDSLKAIAGKMDTGFIDAEAVLAFAKGRTLVNPEPRIEIAK